MGTLTKYELRNFGCSVFFETGTGNGASLRHARQFGLFNHLLSVEINVECYNNVLRDFSADSRVTLVNQDSLSAMEAWLPRIPNDQRILFFLDAHFPGEFTKSFGGYATLQPDNVCMPLESELRCISRLRPCCKDVILVDDWRLYEDLDYENGQLPKDLRILCEKASASFHPEEIFPDSRVTRILRDEGYLLVQPLGENNDLVGLSLLGQLRRNFKRAFKKI